MARITFLIERLPPHQDPIGQMAYSLILQLAEQQHQVQIYTTYRDGDDLPPHHPRIEILRPLRKWNWLEVPRLLAMMIDFKPEILHVIDPHAEALEGYTNALRAVPGFVPLMNRPKLALSFFDVHAKRLDQLKFLTAAADLVTVSNHAQLQTMRDACAEIHFTPQIRLLPAPAHRSTHLPQSAHSTYGGTQSSNAMTETSPLETFIACHHDFCFVPGELDLHSDLENALKLFSRLLNRFEKTALLLGGGWGSIGSIRRRTLMRIIEDSNIGARVFISGPMSASDELLAFRACRFASFLSLPDGTLAFTQSLQRGLLSEAVFVLNQSQVDRDALPWRDGETAIICSTHYGDWEATFTRLLESDSALLRIRNGLKDFAREQTLDQPGNIMSRWYQELLAPHEQAHS